MVRYMVYILGGRFKTMEAKHTIINIIITFCCFNSVDATFVLVEEYFNFNIMTDVHRHKMVKGATVSRKFKYKSENKCKYFILSNATVKKLLLVR